MSEEQGYPAGCAKCRAIEAEREQWADTARSEMAGRRMAEERSKALAEALRGKCDEYKMHDPGWCAFCDAARAALEQSK